MSRHLGDFDTSAVVYGKFTTFRPSTGAPFTLGGTPALSVYKDNSATQSTTGVTLTVDFDSVTGLHHFAIDTSSDGTFYAAGSFFDVVITTGTVDSVSVVGTVVGGFTLRKNSALKPTTAGRTLDVSAGGEAGLDWANVGSPTTTLALTGTTIATTQKVDVETIKTNPVVNGGTVTFPTNSTVASTTNITAGTITTVTNLTNAPTAGDFTATMKTSIGTVVAASAVASVAGNVGGNVVGSVGSVTGLTAANLDVPISTRLASASYTAPDNAGIASNGVAIAAVGNDVLIVAADIAALSIPTANENADALLDREAGVETNRTLRQAMRLMLAAMCGKVSGADTTSVTIRDTNDSKNRVVATVDANGNRSAVTLDAS